jgi:hypothetical protein
LFLNVSRAFPDRTCNVARTKGSHAVKKPIPEDAQQAPVSRGGLPPSIWVPAFVAATVVLVIACAML